MDQNLPTISQPAVPTPVTHTQPIPPTPLQTPKLPKKSKRLLVLAGVILVLGIVLVTILFLQKKPSTSVPKSPNITSVPTIQTKKLLSAIPFNVWKTYQAVTYTLKYPSDWKIGSQTLPNGKGYTIILRPESASDSATTPSFAIDSINVPPGQSMNDEVAQYEHILQFTQSPITLSKGVAGVRLEGTLPGDDENGKFVQKPIHNVLYVFQAGAVVYTMRYQYDLQEDREINEAFFTQLVTSFTFN